MDNIFSNFLDVCVPYSQEACRDAGKRLGLKFGTSSYEFAKDYSTKGCYAYKGGSYDGVIFYGTGGTEEQTKTALTAPKYRPEGYDCPAKGNLHTLDVPFQPDIDKPTCTVKNYRLINYR